jgi:hypothetical protein
MFIILIKINKSTLLKTGIRLDGYELKTPCICLFCINCRKQVNEPEERDKRLQKISLSAFKVVLTVTNLPPPRNILIQFGRLITRSSTSTSLA